MAEEHDLEQAFIGAVNAMTRHFVIVDGVVTAVDPVKFTADVQIGGDQGAILFAVPLRVLIGVRGSFIELPVNGTDCLITFRDGNLGRPQMYSCDQIEDLLINPVGNVIFNDGKLGGMVKVMEALGRWNLIEKDINLLKQAFAAWVVVPSDGGGALKTITADWFAQQLTPTKLSDIENKKIQQ